MDFLRGKKFTQRSVSEGSGGEKKPTSPKTASPKTPPSPFSLAPSPTTTPTPPSNLKTTKRPHPHPPLPNTDPLPTDPGLLEGLLNHHASQLKKLADRVEYINEWIEMDGIVLARMVDELTQKMEKENGKGKGKAKDNGVGAVEPPSNGPTTPRRLGIDGPACARTPIVRFEGPQSSEPELTTEERVSADSNIRNARERIRSMKKWRKELERSVFWQRKEFSRVEKAMGKQKGEAEVAEEERMGCGGAWGVGGKTWEKGSGRLPTQVEWEVMFGSQRLRWDEKGPKPNH